MATVHANCCLLFIFARQPLHVALFSTLNLDGLRAHAHAHTLHNLGNVFYKHPCAQIQVIRGGKEGQEDLMGRKWRGGKEEGGRKEALL